MWLSMVRLFNLLKCHKNFVIMNKLCVFVCRKFLFNKLNEWMKNEKMKRFNCLYMLWATTFKCLLTSISLVWFLLLNLLIEVNFRSFNGNTYQTILLCSCVWSLLLLLLLANSFGILQINAFSLCILCCGQMQFYIFHDGSVAWLFLSRSVLQLNCECVIFHDCTLREVLCICVLLVFILRTGHWARYSMFWPI